MLFPYNGYTYALNPSIETCEFYYIYQQFSEHKFEVTSTITFGFKKKSINSY